VKSSSYFDQNRISIDSENLITVWSAHLEGHLGNLPPKPLFLERNPPMAYTPSKEYKRREREQKKLEKRMARDAAKAEKKAEQEAAALLAEEEAAEKARWDALTPEEQEFETLLKEEEAEKAAKEEDA